MLLLVLGLVTLGLLLAHFPPDQHPFYPRCVFEAQTGWLCPGCGSFRALHALTQGDFARALRSNLLLTVGLPVIAVWVALALWRRDLPVLSRGVPGWLGWATLAILLLFSLVRNLPGPLSGWLAP
jgi:hypothetical protein